jgi:hypothetical protein
MVCYEVRIAAVIGLPNVPVWHHSLQVFGRYVPAIDVARTPTGTQSVRLQTTGTTRAAFSESACSDDNRGMLVDSDVTRH